MPKLPFEQWFWNDWFADEAVTALDPKSRCVWFELLGRMHQRQTSRLRAPDHVLARYARVSVSDLVKGLKEIAKHEAGIVEFGEEITVICKRDSKLEYQRQLKTERQKQWRNRERTPQDVDADVDTETSTKTSLHARATQKFIKEKEEKESQQQPPSGGYQHGAVKPYPGTTAEIKAAAGRIGYLMSEAEAIKFLADHQSVNWIRNRQPIADWTRLLPIWKNNQRPEQRRQAIEESQGAAAGGAADDDDCVILPDGTRRKAGVV